MAIINLDLAAPACACQPSTQDFSSSTQLQPEPWVPTTVADPVDEAEVPSSVCCEDGSPLFHLRDNGVNLTLFWEPSTSEQCIDWGLLTDCGVSGDYMDGTIHLETEVAFGEWLSALDAEERAKKKACCSSK